jgi:hypothetical protein
MVELDGGTCPTPFRLLSRALEGQGRLAEARDAAVSEIDSVHYPLLAFLAAPQAGTAAREVLTRAAARHGLDAMDLRPVFAGHAGTPLPGRRLFLDYCHLTVEGMKVAMAAVAERVLARAGIEIAWQELARLPGPALTPEAEAVARLGAAVHTAHRLLAATPLAAGLLAHWCAEALAASPGVSAAMLDLAAARTATGPAVLTAAQQRNLASPYRLTLQHGWRWDGLDAGLLSAMATAIPEGAAIERFLLARRGLGEDGEDLSRPPFHAEPLLRFYPELLAPSDLAGRAALRCPWPTTPFWLVADGSRDIHLELIARLPRVAGRTLGRRETVAVEVSRAAVGAFEVAESWSRGEVRIARERLRPGANRLTLRWPPPPPLGDEALAFARRRLEEGIEADLHPVFGEVWSLIARRV